MSRWGLVAATALSLAAAGARDGSAQPRQDDGIRVTPRSVHDKGEYGGVQPGVATPRSWKGKRPVRNRARRKNLLTWVGFQPAGDRGSRIFVQLTGELEYSQRVEGDTLVVTLVGARFGGTNARRRLDARFFDTAVRQVTTNRIKRQRRSKRRRGRRGRASGGVEVRIAFKNPADAAEGNASMATSKEDGYTYLFLDLAAPSGNIADSDDDDTNDDDELSEDEGISDAE